MIARVQGLLEPVRSRAARLGGVALNHLAIAAAKVGDIVEYVGPTVQRIFHIGFIPLVIILGMQTEPRPKLTDLFTPM